MTPVADRNIPQFYQPRTPFSTSTFCILQCLHRLVSVWFWSRMIFCTLVLTTVNIMINPCCGSHVPDVSFLAAQYEFNVASWDPIRNIPPGPKLHISKIVQITVPKSKTYLFFWYSLPKKTYVHQFAEKPRLCPCADPRRHVFGAGLRVAGHGNGAGSLGRWPAAAWDFGVVAGEAWSGRAAGGEGVGHQAEAGNGGGWGESDTKSDTKHIQTYDGEIPNIIISHISQTFPN